MFYAFLAIVGGVVGSGFITGKEIAVFFARNGLFAFVGAIFSTIFFFFLFKYFLFHGEKVASLLASSKMFLFISISLNVILSASMMAGIVDISCEAGEMASLIIIITLISCLFVFKKGIRALDNFNMALVPLMIVVFVIIFLPKISLNFHFAKGGIISSLWFSILYTVLNIANMTLLLSSLGAKLRKKQKTQVAFWATLALGILLLLVVAVLLQNQSVIGQDMPLLSLVNSWQNVVMSGLIFLGSVTSLFSFVYASSSSLRGLNKNEMINFFLSILLPLIISFLGFGFIVTYIYPLASVLGILLLGMIFLPRLFFTPFLKYANKKIHSSCKHAKQNDTGHDDVKF